MRGVNFNEIVDLIVRGDPRYAKGAYFFMRLALDFTLKSLAHEEGAPPRHVSGAELCEGIRAFALEQFGPMTLTLLQHWGIHATSDFGNIVFNLIEYGVFGKQENDKLSDFEEVYDFKLAFAEPFLPQSKRQQHPSTQKA